MFASDLDAASRAQLARGSRLVELLKQPQYSPYAMEEQAVAIWTGTSGQLDNIPAEDVRRFESELLDHLRRNTKILDTIRETKNVDDDTEASLKSAVVEFKNSFTTGEGHALGAAGAETVETPLAEEDIDQAQIVRQKRG